LIINFYHSFTGTWFSDERIQILAVYVFQLFPELEIENPQDLKPFLNLFAKCVERWRELTADLAMFPFVLPDDELSSKIMLRA
jgi:hypothetical protein